MTPMQFVVSAACLIGGCFALYLLVVVGSIVNHGLVNARLKRKTRALSRLHREVTGLEQQQAYFNRLLEELDPPPSSGVTNPTAS